MNWYYASNGQQLGPVDDAQLDALVAAGTVTPDSLVWREGMANWQPLGQARPSTDPSAQANAARCAVCGGGFTPEGLIRIADRMVCAQCKPVVLQQLQEGALRPAAGVFEYGGFWIRVGAKIIDTIVVLIPTYAVDFALALAMFGTITPQPTPGDMGMFWFYQAVAFVLNISIAFVFTGFFLSKYGATPGKMACRLKVVRPDGSGLSFWHGGVRYLGEFLSSMICLIGYLIMISDEEKRTLHDRICGTRVVKK